MKLSPVLMSFFPRNARATGPTSSTQQNAMMNEIGHDLANISSQINNTLVPLVDTIPDGTLDININAFLNGLDARTLFADASATSSTNPSYCLGGTGRPITIYEQFQNIQGSIGLLTSALQTISGYNSPFTFYNGNVGINTATPSWPLSFGPTFGNLIGLYDDGGGTGIGLAIGLDNTLQFLTTGPNPFAFGYGSTTSMTKWFTINSLGNIGVGLDSAAYRFDVSGNAVSGFAANFFNDGNAANRHGIRVQAGADSNGAGQTKYLSCWDGNATTEVGYIEHSSGGTFQLVNPSDQSLKTNIMSSDIDALSVINKLSVRQFDWKDGTTPHTRAGFIAQECIPVWGEMVSTNSDTGLKGVSTTALIPVLVKAIQELTEQVNELKSQMAAI